MPVGNAGLDHAVVLGGSMAGLPGARVLADHYQRVTLIERDILPGVGEHRKGVPHGRRLHGLHPRGREILDEFSQDSPMRSRPVACAATPSLTCASRSGATSCTRRVPRRRASGGIA